MRYLSAKRHFFSRKAIPALYRHVEGNVHASLDRAVSGKVNITADSWSSRHGQGRYLSFTQDKVQYCWRLFRHHTSKMLLLYL